MRKKSTAFLAIFLCLMMVFSLSACGSGGGGDQTPEPSQQEDGESHESPEGEAPAEAPEIKGLTFESELETYYADQFKVYRYEGGYKYFHIVDGDDFLLVPEGGSVPEGLDESVTVLQGPVENIYLAATAQMALFLSMDGADSVRMTSLRQDGWTYDEPKKLLDEGKIVFAGKYSEPDYELLLDEDCGLAIESTM
ncbi:MAG: ABC transporter substrate-binding protein, partial [Firmicutes bacterium]|nr:ABC transporter substrate-binding protein [Bacillota bacterium]